MNEQTVLLEALLAGFFAVACLRCWVSAARVAKAGFTNLLRFPSRWERLHRSRWQWFSMVLLMLVLRLQHELPLILEITAVLQFLLFISLPGTNTSGGGKGRRGHVAVVGNR